MRIRPLALIIPAVLVPLLAQAHISLSGTGFAGTSSVFIVSVGHGCESDGQNLDTSSVTVEIPAGVTSVRPDPSGFDSVEVQTDDTGAVVSVTWSKEKALETDIAFYGLGLRMKAPERPFTMLTFPAHQTCKSADGKTEVVVDWVGAEGDTDVEPAPVLRVLPTRTPGWNKYTVESDIKDLETFFADAQIVWQGSAAYSVSPATTELIEGTEGVTALSKIKANKEFWVKY